ncbi:MAG: hypothetical protein IAF08_07495, partial [Rhizobacter sp.]|nr:hypothetical protein [Chlorobiales bacterium]
MIQYDSKSWLASLFTLRGLYLRRIFWSLLFIVALTTLICLLDFTFNVIDIRLPLSEHSLMGVVLGLLLVFR